MTCREALRTCRKVLRISLSVNVVLLILTIVFAICLATSANAAHEVEKPPDETIVYFEEPAADPLPETTALEVEEAEPPLEEIGTFKITAYCSCVKCCGIWSEQHPSRKGTDYIQKTASGTIPKAGRTVAADTSVLPFGTVIIIDGHEYTVEDRGGAVGGNVIDIFFDSHQDALNWGVQYKTIYIKKGDI